MAAGSAWQRPDLVPLEERLRFLQLFRVAVVVVTIAIGVRGGDQVPVPAIMGLGAAALGGGLIARLCVRSAAAGRWLFGIVLLGDGLLLAALVHLLGGLASPGRYLVVLHVLVVTLIASYRTGLKLAIWHALLVLVLHEAAEIGWLRAAAVADPTAALFTYIGLVWTVALLTASASAVNEREILRRRYDLDAFARMSGALELATGLHDVARTVVDHVCENFGASRGGIVSVRDDDPVMIAGRGLARVSSAGQVDGLVAAAAEGRRTLLVTRLDAGNAWLAGHMPDAQHVMLVPLAVEGTVEDVLVIEHGREAHGGLKRSTMTTIERFAAHGALALRNAKLHGELVAMARTDGLTGVANRVAFDQALNGELDRLERTGGSLALVLCDLDHFKHVNDEFGHQVGDAVLSEAARTLRGACRTYDVVARYGGEEFAVIMPLTTSDVAADVAERLRQAVAEITDPVDVTMSLGLAVATEPVAARDLIAAADRALYRAKRDGRNRLELARTVSSPAPPGSGVQQAVASGTPAQAPDE